MITTENTAALAEAAAKSKSRNQSTFEFFEMLQIECLVAELRIKIYPKLKDKEYWKKKVYEGKKATILDIANRNRLPTIFDDDQLEQALKQRIYRADSYPIFVYRDENHRNNQEYYDLLYYYNKGSEVRFEYFGEVKVGRVKDYRPFSKEILISFEEIEDDKKVQKEEKFPVAKVTRIL
jgi:hypothetical protein